LYAGIVCNKTLKTKKIRQKSSKMRENCRVLWKKGLLRVKKSAFVPNIPTTEIGRRGNQR